jgi:hypothetical protein
MKIPVTPISYNGLLFELTHGMANHDGVINMSLTLKIDRAKYVAGESLLDCLPVAIPNFKPDIENFTTDYQH